MTSARADMARMTLEMTSTGNPVVRGARKVRGSTSPKLRAAHKGSWTIRKKILMMSAETRLEIP